MILIDLFNMDKFFVICIDYIFVNLEIFIVDGEVIYSFVFNRVSDYYFVKICFDLDDGLFGLII